MKPGHRVNLLVLAIKNLSRHRMKTVFTVIAVTVAVMLFIFSDSLLLGMDLDSQRNLVNFETGSAKIYSKFYFEKKDELPLYESFGNYQRLLANLEQAGYNGAPHAVFVGSLMSVDQELPFMFVGIEPELETKVFNYHKYLEGEESTFLKNGKFDVILGVKGARDLNVKVGDKVRCAVTIDMKDENGRVRYAHQLIDLSVRGIVNSPNPKTNGNIAYLPLDILQDEMGIMLEGQITEICIRKVGASDTGLPDDDEDPGIITAKLPEDLPGDLILVGWQEDAKDFLAISRTKNFGNKLILSILLLLSVIGITNTMLMAVFERTKEIGMLRAQGMKDSQVFKLIIFEAGAIGFLGTVIGLILGAGITYLGVEYGLDYTDMIEQMNVDDFGYRVLGIFKGAWNPITMIICFFAGPIVSMIAAFWPALRATKLNIVECLRFE